MAQFEDRNFDDFAGRFEKNIYQQTKGKIRLKLVLEDITEIVPNVDCGGLTILDAGCGTGYLSSLLAEKASQRFTLCDISSSMLEQAKQRFEGLDKTEAIFYQVPIQKIYSEVGKEFDLVMVHAVLEWLARPKEALEAVLPAVRSGGYLSLLFYNKHSLVYRHLIMGNYRRLNDREVNGFGGTLTPTNPQDPYEVEGWLTGLGLEVVRKTGVRTFFDYQSREVKDDRSFEDTYEMEQRYARQLPFLYLGRYIHFLCRKL